MAKPTAGRHTFEAAHMGTRVRIVCAGVDETTAEQAAAAAFARIAALDAMLSDWDRGSELSRLTDRAHPEPAVVSWELWGLLSQATGFAEQSGGAFDPTVGPAIRLWRRARRQLELPSAARLQDALARIDWRAVELLVEEHPGGEDALLVRLAHPGMQLDLGGIAKGFAADRALRVLREHGVDSALVDLGGDMVLGDPPPGASGWTVGLAPMGAQDGERHTVTLANTAVATSGDAYRFVEIDGVRYSHIVDPRTGLGLTTPIGVTVVSPDGATADAVASSLCVLGPLAGMELAKRRGYEARMVWRDDQGTLREWRSPGFPPLRAVPED
jgi:thiamine biosynthesis lipoprotein